MTVDSRWTDEIEHTTALADQILTLLDGVPLPVAAAAAGLALTRVLRAIDRKSVV